MNRINKLFQVKPDHLLSVYFTAGFPEGESTPAVLNHLQNAGADMIEIGIPFSDPMADGPIIQESNSKALKNGMTLRKLFSQLDGIRNKIHVPLLLMGYLNPVLQYGIERFAHDCKNTGIDGVIIPDLPLDIYNSDYRSLWSLNGLSNIFLITPQTSEERIRLIDRESNGFIYMVSSSSTTGKRDQFSEGHIEYFRRIKNMSLSNPVMAGFGISNHENFDIVCKYAHGAIIGSAFVKMLAGSVSLEDDIIDFVRTIRGQKKPAVL